MTEPTARMVAPARSTAPIVCRLRPRVGRQGPSSLSGEVELENVSGTAVEIEVSMHPLQYLTLVVTDSRGTPVPAPPYGNVFSPREKPYMFRVGPGEKYIHGVSLLGLLSPEELGPGTYVVRAIYDYRGVRAISEPLTVELSDRR